LKGGGNAGHGHTIKNKTVTCSMRKQRVVYPKELKNFIVNCSVSLRASA